MITLDVCIEPLFVDLPTEDRIARIGQAGYGSVEFWLHDAEFTGAAFDFTKPRDPAAIRQACAAAGVTLHNVVVNPPDDGSIGGSPVMASTRSKYLARVEATIAFAQAAGCGMAITCAGDEQPGMTRSAMRDAVEKALGEAAAIAEKKGFTLLLEPLNTHVDHKGYCLSNSTEGAEIVRAVGSPALRLLYDVYHMQIMEGNLLSHIREGLDVIGHFHSAAVPGRGEHGRGELSYPGILQSIADMGYTGAFGLEYFPAMADHLESLRSVRAHLTSSGVCE